MKNENRSLVQVFAVPEWERSWGGRAAWNAGAAPKQWDRTGRGKSERTAGHVQYNFFRKTFRNFGEKCEKYSWKNKSREENVSNFNSHFCTTKTLRCQNDTADRCGVNTLIILKKKPEWGGEKSKREGNKENIFPAVLTFSFISFFGF